ncbi:hypothetical protein F5B22DRAFT_457479 [Xylaria bambusicola]|uniref:uncharacterized protein n=1 Tax=Xylaria bambusicola TaxID=326684 RepID=UPI0020082361|nr:uncharacterized protein F5B22DRAFT_457479 [Xylaria bambusicola]KAI0522065.1 hypothetical protein F5B22DRAFT_457479 [Xylaria bambusicola]
MKPILALMLFPIPVLSLGWQVRAWQWRENVQDFFGNPYKKSRVPQFMLDSNHPWILENQAKLEKLPDAESYLCFSSQGHTIDVNRGKPGGEGNGLAIPPDLFDYLEIDNSRFGISRPGWPNALLRAQEIQRCPAALSQAKTFKTRIYVYESEYSDWDKRILEPPQPPRELLDLYADILGNTSLETLKWDIAPKYAHYFGERFVDRGLAVPTAKTLEVSPMNHFLVPMCSNITELVYQCRTWERYFIHGGEDPELLLLQASMFTPNLTRLVMDAEWEFDNSKVQALVSTIPGLRSLGLRGELRSQYRYSNYGDSSGSMLNEILQILGSLQNLTQLELPDASALDLGWDGGPMCGNAYFGPGGRDYERLVYRDALEATERAAAIVVKVLPRLTDFSIGSDQAIITRYENGTLRASFPWTGRLDEYIMEILPGGPDGPD